MALYQRVEMNILILIADKLSILKRIMRSVLVSNLSLYIYKGKINSAFLQNDLNIWCFTNEAFLIPWLLLFIEVIIGFPIKMYATTQDNSQSQVRTKQNNNEAVRFFVTISCFDLKLIIINLNISIRSNFSM